jgi:tetratricopeptide (TPR) repeat protein
MAMDRRILKYFAFFFLVVFTVSACSSVRHFAGYFDFGQSAKEQATEKKLQKFARSLRTIQGNSASHFYLARYYQERGNHWAAITELEKTLSMDPEHVRALNALGVSYDFVKKHQNALACYEAALKLDPDSANVYYNNIGQSWFQQKIYFEAIEAFRHAAAYDEDFPDARVHNNLGRAYAMTGQYHLALAEFELAGGDSAESVLELVLREAEEENQTSGVAIAATDEKAKDFSLRISRFLKEPQEPAGEGAQAAALAKAPKKPTPEELAAEICVEVSNGNGRQFTARSMRDYLLQKGVRVTRVTNGINVQRTYIYYEAGHAEQARTLAAHLPVSARLKEVSGFDNPEIKIRILLGKDMAGYIRKLLESPATLNPWIGA